MYAELDFPEDFDARLRDGALHVPAAVIVDNHRACNAACRMCPTQQLPVVNGKMSDEVFNALLEQLASVREHIQMVLFGVHGEPMLDTDIEDRVAALVDAGVDNVHVNTNGAALTARRSRRLMEAGIKSITISLDGFNAETFEAIRIGLKYQMVMNNIEQCLRNRSELNLPVRIVLRFIAQTTNQNEIEAWKRYWQERLDPQLDTVEIIPIHNWAYTITPEQDLSTSCGNVFNAVVVSHDGSIPLCCLDHEATYEFGNITKAHLIDIFNNEQYAKTRALHNSGQRAQMELCRTCDRPETRAVSEADPGYLIERERAFSWTRTDEKASEPVSETF